MAIVPNILNARRIKVENTSVQSHEDLQAKNQVKTVFWQEADIENNWNKDELANQKNRVAPPNPDSGDPVQSVHCNMLLELISELSEMRVFKSQYPTQDRK